jgi:hypothetical protein
MNEIMNIKAFGTNIRTIYRISSNYARNNLSFAHQK